MKPTGAVIAPLAVLLLLAACGGGDGREVASGTVKDGDGKSTSYSVREGERGSTMTVKSADGDAVIRTGGDHKAALPDGLAVYPGATVTNSISVDSDKQGQGGAQVTFESPDPAAKIVAWYKAAAAGAGYKTESEMTMGDLAMIGGRKGDGAAGRAFQLMVNRADGKSVVTLIAGGK